MEGTATPRQNGTVEPTGVTVILTTTPPTDDFHPGIQNLFIVYYSIVFLSGLIGNIIIIMSVYKFKRMRTVVNVFLVNLALSDLLFVALSLFDGLAFVHGGWIFGDSVCRIQSTFIEISYTVSVCTLTAVAFERYMSICHPYKLKRTFNQALKACAFIWLSALLFCACLSYGYQSRPDEQNVMQCRNDYWSKESRIAFYVIHSIIVYLIPLIIMCCSHVNISRVLMEQKMNKTGLTPTFTAINSNSNNKESGDVPGHILSKPKQKVTSKTSSASMYHSNAKQKEKTANRRMKIVKLLVVVTTIFFMLWTPFIIVRLVQYIGIEVNQMLWRASQLLILGNTAVNCFIYALMSPAFRSAFKSLFTCGRSLTTGMDGINSSKSFDLSETVKKQYTISRSDKKNNKI